MAPQGPSSVPPSLIFAAAAQLNQMAAELAQSFGPGQMAPPPMPGPAPMPAGGPPMGEPDGDEPPAPGKKPAPKAKKKPADDDGDEG